MRSDDNWESFLFTQVLILEVIGKNFQLERWDLLSWGLFFLKRVDQVCVCCPFYREVNYFVKVKVIRLQIEFVFRLVFWLFLIPLVNPSIKFTSNVWSFKSRGYFLRWKIFTSLVMSPKVKRIDPFLQFMIAFAVAKKGHPKMTGVWAFGFSTGCVSKTIKSTRYMNSPTRIRTSVISP